MWENETIVSERIDEGVQYMWWYDNSMTLTVDPSAQPQTDSFVAIRYTLARPSHDVGVSGDLEERTRMILHVFDKVV
jgi:hypothetical protein